MTHVTKYLEMRTVRWSSFINTYAHVISKTKCPIPHVGEVFSLFLYLTVIAQR